MIEDAAGIDNYLERNEAMERKRGFIGLSISKCAVDIVRGRVKMRDVKKIISRTAFWNEKELEMILHDYADRWRWDFGFYWRVWGTKRMPKEEVIAKRIERAKAITRRLYRAGMIEQPRITEGRYADLGEAKTNWVVDEKKITWTEDDCGPTYDWDPPETVEEIAAMTKEQVEDLEDRYRQFTKQKRQEAWEVENVNDEDNEEEAIN